MARKKLADLEGWLATKNSQNTSRQDQLPGLRIDFSADPLAVKAIVEAQRLAFAHSFFLCSPRL